MMMMDDVMINNSMLDTNENCDQGQVGGENWEEARIPPLSFVSGALYRRDRGLRNTGV